jgi:hypothetical protein
VSQGFGLAVSSAGEIFIYGITNIDPATFVRDAYVARLAPSNGAIVWDRTYDDGDSEAVYDVAVASGGHPVFRRGDAYANAILFLLDRLDGSTIWDVTSPTLETGGNIGLGLPDYLYAVGNQGSDATVVRMSLADGSELWDQAIPTADGRTTILAVGAAGAAIATGETAPPRDVVVSKLEAGTGTELWTTTIDGSASSSSDGLDGIVLLPSGDVVVAATLQESDQAEEFSIVHVSGADGSIDGSATSATERRPLARRTSLISISPNPLMASEGTRVSFGVDRAGPVSVIILDVRGRLVRELLNEERPAGHHELHWDGRDNSGRHVGAGIYFVRTTQEGTSAAGKTTVLR